MTLNREVCKRCRALANIEGWRWEREDDRLWTEHGYVFCMERYRRQEDIRVHTDSVPDCCPLVTEHAVSQ